MKKQSIFLEFFLQKSYLIAISKMSSYQQKSKAEEIFYKNNFRRRISTTNIQYK